MNKTFTKGYLEWSKKAQKAQIDMDMPNKQLAADLGYTRQYVSAVVNGRRECDLAIARISKQLNIAKPNAL